MLPYSVVHQTLEYQIQIVSRQKSIIHLPCSNMWIHG